MDVCAGFVSELVANFYVLLMTLVAAIPPMEDIDFLANGYTKVKVSMVRKFKDARRVLVRFFFKDFPGEKFIIQGFGDCDSYN